MVDLHRNDRSVAQISTPRPTSPRPNLNLLEAVEEFHVIESLFYAGCLSKTNQPTPTPAAPLSQQATYGTQQAPDDTTAVDPSETLTSDFNQLPAPAPLLCAPVRQPRRG